MIAKPRELVVVRFPFADLSSSKQRPALVLSSVRGRSTLGLGIVAMITSRIDAPKLPGDVFLEDWKAEGLLHPSRLRLAKIATLDESLLVKRIGVLTKGDFERAKKALRQVLSDWA